MKTFRRWMPILFLVVLTAWPSVVFACEGCKTTAQEAGTPNQIGEAFGWSIYFMLAVPTIIVTILVRAIVRRCREMDQEHAHLFAAQAAPTRSAGNLDGLGAAIPVR